MAREPLEYLDAFDQITQFATQDRPDLVEGWKNHRKPTEERAAAFRQRLLDNEPRQLKSVLEFAERAWRRPLVDVEKEKLRALYHVFRGRKLEHDTALRITLTRVVVAPGFLYPTEQPASGNEAAPVTDLELAIRLSYFLCSSLPDAELRRIAGAGELRDPENLAAQTKRLLSDDRVRRLAIQFGCQWLGVRGFDQLDEKSERNFPDFKDLRGSMYEETIRFFTDLFQADGPLLSLLDANHTFVNAELANLYGITVPETTETWFQVGDVNQAGRGGILGFATTLTKQSGASRTSPILRGNWISETLLGERLPKPLRDVPQLPAEVPFCLSERELIAKHSADPSCAKCHAKIDPYGFALENFDAIGRWRGNSNTQAVLPDGKSIEGIDGLRHYLLNDRRDAFVRHFCHKLLGFALGRAVKLSDEPLLDDMMTKLKSKDYRFSVAVDPVVLSSQFRSIRGAGQ